MINEEWRDVKGFEGMYEVSNKGNIRSVDRFVNNKSHTKTLIKGTNIKPQINHKGYMAVILHKEGRPYSRVIHRLVAEAFIDNPNKLPQVNHIDTIKTNNAVENLEWITNYDNMQHAIANGCYDNAFTERRLLAVKENLKKAVESRKRQVSQYDRSGKFIRTYSSTREAGMLTGTCDSKITSVCRGKRKTTGGYIWKYGGGINE